jgi:hypothetical protein
MRHLLSDESPVRLAEDGPQPSLPHSCKNEWRTTVTNSHVRVVRTAANLGMRMLILCAKRPSKQRVAGSNPAGRASQPGRRAAENTAAKGVHRALRLAFG